MNECQTIRHETFLPKRPEPRAEELRQERKDRITRERAAGYRVDTIPWPVRPIYIAVMWGIGLLMYLYYFLCRITSQVTIEGPGNRNLGQHVIYCLWHESWWSYFVVFFRYPSAHALMSHPAAYMKPVHTVFRLMGVKRLFLGSSGDEGKQAANELASVVRRGYSTTISPDGPYGPPRILKKGVLHIALQSGVPIVPLTISSSRFVSWPSWDSKKLPLPFSRIKVTVYDVIYVTQENFSDAARQIISALGDPGTSVPERNTTEVDDHAIVFPTANDCMT
jgi:lysophospholipid acyltransferase (LPLAT)-like uncharacterized protein